VQQETPNVATYLYYEDPITTWEPAAAPGAAAGILNNVYDTLLRYDGMNDEIIPRLATSYSVSDDGLTWTFKIREGVKFHDGTNVDAEAVRFSIQRYIDKGTGGGYMWGPVESINVVDEYTVEFKLYYPAPLDLIAAAPYANFILSPTAIKAHPDDWLAQGNEAGSGPYMLKEWNLGESVVLEKFPDYWEGWDGPHYDIIDYRMVAEAATRRQLIEKGDADVAIKLSPEDLTVLADNPEVEVVLAPTYAAWGLAFNTQKAPLDNKLVRQALSYAFPYEQVVQYAFSGIGIQARGALASNLWGHGEDLFQYYFDLEKAQELLIDAGYPEGGFSLTCNYLTGDESEKRMVEQYKAELAKLNIDLDIRAMTWDAMWEQAKSAVIDDRQDIFVAEGFPDYADPYSLLYIAYRTEEEVYLNLAYYSNPEFDELIDTAFVVSAVDRNQAAEMYVQAQEMLIEDAPVISAVEVKMPFVLSKNFKGFEPNPALYQVIFFYDTYPGE
jgi:peptide/nickel transport system substrate-binding protein